MDDFEHGVFFVDLAPIKDPALVGYTIGQTLGVREARHQSLFQHLKHFLRDKQVLLLLDNFEQVTAAAPLVAELLAACPAPKILVTSRAALHLRWEHEFPVPPLGLPDLQHLPAVKELSGCPAVALFIERAGAVKPDFVLTNHNAPAVAEICTRLDGLPLAIELAAARIKLLPPQAMLQRLQHRLDLLTAGPRDLPARQQTLGGAIAWSYGLLEAPEQKLFRRLSVFVGGCSLEAAEAVCKPEGDVQMNVLEGLASLVNESLLRQEEQADGEPRFRMLETTREYALEQLAKTGEMEEIQRRHAAFYLSFAEAAQAELHGTNQTMWLDRLTREHDNMRTVLRWSLEAGETEMALRLSGALWWFWENRGYLAEGQRWLEEALSRGATAAPAIRAKALHGAGSLARDRGDYQRAMAYLQESLALRRALGDKRKIATSLNNLGNVAADQGDYATARALHEESLNLFREVGDKLRTAYLLDNLGSDLHFRGEYGPAMTLHEESLVLFRELGDKRGQAQALHNLGVAARGQGDYRRARGLHEESLALLRELGHRGGIALALLHLGLLARYRGEPALALASCREALNLFWEVGDRRRVAESLEALAGVAAAQGQTDRTAQMFGAAEALREGIGAPLPPDARSDYDRDVAALRASIGEDAFGAAWAAGRAMSLEQAVEYAMAAVESGLLPSEVTEEPSPGRPPIPLTRREQEVAALVAQGLTNREIATALTITEGTAENHVQHILNKLGFHSRAQIAVWTVEHGVVSNLSG